MIFPDGLLPFEKPHLLYTIGKTILTQNNGSRMVTAYFLDPHTSLSQVSSLEPHQLPLGSLPILKPGYLYQAKHSAWPILEWNGCPVQTEILSLQNMKESDVPFQMPFLTESSRQRDPNLFQSVYFQFHDNSPAPQTYLIASSEIVRAFFAPTSSFLDFLYSEKFIDDYVTYSPSSHNDVCRLFLSDDSPPFFKKDATLQWLYWILSSDSLYSEWKSAKSAFQTSQIFQAKLPLPMPAKMRCLTIPFQDRRLIWCIEKIVPCFPDCRLEASIPKARSISHENSSTASEGQSPDPSRICGDAASAHKGSETEINIPSPFVFGKSLKIHKTPRPSGLHTQAKSHPHSVDPSEKNPLSVQESQPYGTNPPGSLSPQQKNAASDDTGDILQIVDVEPGFQSFFRVLKQLFRSIPVLNVHLQYYEFPAQHPLSHIDLSGEMPIRRTYAVCSFAYRGKFFSILEIDLRDGKGISTLLFRSAPGSDEAAAHHYIQLLSASGGQWNRDSLARENAVLVRHCSHQAKALCKHIQELS